MAGAAPRIYVEDPVALTLERLRAYTGWDPGEPDLGTALVRIFGHLAGIGVDRINQVPERNFRAFLDLIGVRPRPGRPARVPLTFQLAPGTPLGAVVPARTQAAAQSPDGEPIVFETEAEQFAIAAALADACVVDPRTDRWSRWSPEAAFPAFGAHEPIVHRLYLAAAVLARPGEKHVVLELGDGALDQAWPLALSWDRSDGEQWHPIDVTYDSGSASVTFTALPPVTPVTVAGVTAPWLRATLTTSIPRDGLGELGVERRRLALPDTPPDAVLSGLAARTVARDISEPFLPLPSVEPGAFLAIACDEAFSKPGAAITLRVAATTPSVGRLDMWLRWEYSRGDGQWAVLGVEVSADAGAPATAPTRALLDDGTVTLACPPDWRPATLGGMTARWLRAYVTSASYTATELPLVESLALDYEWDAPLIERPGVQVVLARQEDRPAAAFANADAIDLNRDFFPFGDAPRLNDVLYIRDDEAFAPPARTLVLGVSATNPDDVDGTPPPALPSADLALAWEYWDADEKAWLTLRVARDTTGRLVKDGIVELAMPDTIGTVEVNGVTGRWVRARIARGGYGRPARYVPLPSGGVVLDPPTFRPPSIKSLTIAYGVPVISVPVDGVLTENHFDIADRTSAPAPFAPFTPVADERPALYLGFDGPLPDRAASVFLSVAETPYTPALLRRRIDGGPPVVTWEFYDVDERHWERLGADDETGSLTRAGLVRFIAPPTSGPSAEFGASRRWLRAKWERGTYLHPPTLRRALTNTAWAVNATTVDGEALGSGTGEPAQVLRLTGTPVVEGQAIEVRESQAPAAAELLELGDEPLRVVLDASGRPAETWIRWAEVTDFYGSGPRSRHYVLDRLSGEVRFGDGQSGMVLPIGSGNVRATYRRGGGQAGNVAAGAIVQLKSAVPYVEAVTNHESAAGGSPQEDIAAVRDHGPKRLRHGGRAVTAVDFEDLAAEASTDVARTFAVPVRRGEEPGRVGLIVVPRSGERRPDPSVELLATVEAHVRARVTPTFDLWVAGPGWIEVTVDAEIVPEELGEAAHVEGAVRAALDAFLHPLTGGSEGAGWRFGRRPHRSDLLALMERLEGVDYVRALFVAERLDRAGPAPDSTLVYAGPHSIVMTAGE